MTDPLNKLPVRDDVARSIEDDFGEYDPTYWQRGKITISFAASIDHFGSAEDAVFQISNMLFDRFEGFYHEVIWE